MPEVMKPVFHQQSPANQAGEIVTDRMENNNHAKMIWITGAFLVLVIIIFAVFVDIDALLRILKRVRLEVYLVGVVFLVVGIVFITVRWRFLLGNEPGFASTFHADSVSYMLKLLLPVPQAVIRLTAFSLTSSISIYQSAPMMIIERFLETLMRVAALTLTVVLILDIPLWIAGVGIGVILLLGIPAFLMWLTRNAANMVPRLIERSVRIPGLSKEKLGHAIVDFQENVSTIRSGRGLTTVVVYSLVMWGLFLLFYASGFLALNLRLDSREIVAMSALVLAVLPPSTPAMIGVYQGLTVAILLPFGFLDVNTATAYGLLMFGAQLFIWFVLGIWSLNRTDIKISKLSTASFHESRGSQ